MTAIAEIQNHAQQIADGKHDTIKPGMPFRIPDSWLSGDAVAQGDLIITVVDKIPAGYKPVAKPTAADKQLVPGNTEGAKHCLESLKGLKLFRPQGWPASAETDYCGPAFTAKNDVTILHPTHGPVTVPAGVTVRCDYQREFDAESQRERRNQD